MLIVLLVSAVVAGWLFDLLAIPVGWLLGPMLVGVLSAVKRGKPQPLDPRYQAVGQVVLGLAIGIGFPLSTLLIALKHAVPLVAAILITGGLSLLNGYLLWRWAGIDRATGFMGSLPGAASSMVAMSDEMGADAVAVAVLQYLRLLLVVFLAPVAVRYLFPPGAGDGGFVAVAGPEAAPLWVNAAVLGLCGVVGAVGGKAVRLPSPTFLGPVLTALIASWTLPWTFHVPTLLFNLSMMLVGLSIGSRFDLTTARKLGRAALIEVGLVLALIGICLVVGYGFHLITGIDTLTAVLGSTPGGMEVMVASAAQLGGDPGLVLAMQMTRWFLVLLAGPWVAVKLIRRKAA